MEIIKAHMIFSEMLQLLFFPVIVKITYFQDLNLLRRGKSLIKTTGRHFFNKSFTPASISKLYFKKQATIPSVLKRFHTFSTLAKFFEKLIFFTSPAIYAHGRELMREGKM